MLMTKTKSRTKIGKDVLLKAFRTMCTAKTMAEVYEEHFKVVVK